MQVIARRVVGNVATLDRRDQYSRIDDRIFCGHASLNKKTAALSSDG